VKTLVIFDSSKSNLSQNAHYFAAGDIVYLFPMSVDKQALNIVAAEAKQRGSLVEIVNTAKLINDTAECVRAKYLKFVAQLPGRISRKGRNLKELFAVDDVVSLWWYSLIAEKSTFKSDAFNKIIQFESIVRTIKEKGIQRILYYCDDYVLGKELCEYSKEHLTQIKVAGVWKNRGMLQDIFQSGICGYLKNIIMLFGRAFKIFLNMRKLKKKSRSLRKPDIAAKKIIFITYYPSMDVRQADKDIFKNNNYPYLQEAMESKTEDILWVSLYIQHSSISFDKALEYLGKFINNGYNIAFIDDFCSIKDHFKTILSMLISEFKFLYYEKDIKRAHEFEGCNIYGFLKQDWRASFIGVVGYAGLLYYFMFRELLKRTKANVCVFPCEMHFWEKALINARDSLKSQTTLFAYQPAGMSRMLLNYFNDPSEMIEEGKYPIPLPDKLLCDGTITNAYMRASGWKADRLEIVEAIRYLHLRKYFSERVKEKKNEILVVLSIHPKESCSILMAAYEAFKDYKEIPVWVKTHPYLSLDVIRNLLKGRVDEIPFPVKEGSLDTFLSEARIVIAGETTTSIEALAYGCELINIDSPDWINMSPLKTMNCPFIRTVASPQELRQAVVGILSEKYDPELNFAEGRKIVEGFFCLDRKSDIPEKFVNLILKENEKK